MFRRKHVIAIEKKKKYGFSHATFCKISDGMKHRYEIANDLFPH